MMPRKDDTLDIPRLATDPDYFAERKAFYQADPQRWFWYVHTHTHRCQCGREISHTGLEAERDGLAAHTCCGRDVRDYT